MAFPVRLAVLLQFFILQSSFVYSAKNPEIFQTPYEIIVDKGYIGDEYIVETEDGYYLTLHRIRSKNPMIGNEGKVVFLQHGLLDSAHTWINNLPSQSLGFILADAGYDVWLGNSRGNTYSRSHVTLDPSDEKFWAFSWDEMAKYDLPAFVNFIIEETGVRKIFYVGHSQGGEMALAALNADTSGYLRDRIAAAALMAPVAFLDDVKSPVRRLAPLCKSFKSARAVFGGKMGQFFPSTHLTRFLANTVCRSISKHHNPIICSNIMFLLAGYDKANMNASRIRVYAAHAPAGTSVQNMVHYCQGMVDGRFEALDFGRKGNMAHYHRITPPPYGLDSVGVPVSVYWGGEDWLATPRDVSRILSGLTKNPNAPEVRDVYVPYYNHLDFVWGLDAAEVIYPDIIRFFEKYQ